MTLDWYVCHACGQRAKIPHGSRGYKRGCKCPICKDAKAAENRRTQLRLRLRRARARAGTSTAAGGPSAPSQRGDASAT